MPLRKAVSRLVAAKALRIAANRAVRFPVMSSIQFRGLAKVRIAIEEHAAAEAPLLYKAGNMASVATADAAMRAEGELATPDFAEAVELRKNISCSVYEATQSSVLVEIICALCLKIGPVINLDLRSK